MTGIQSVSESPYCLLHRRENSPQCNRAGSEYRRIIVACYVGDNKARRPHGLDQLGRGGGYPKELQRISRIATDLGYPTDLVAEGLRRAEEPPSWFAQWR